MWCDTHAEYYEMQQALDTKHRCLSFVVLEEHNKDKDYKERLCRRLGHVACIGFFGKRGWCESAPAYTCGG